METATWGDEARYIQLEWGGSSGGAGLKRHEILWQVGDAKWHPAPAKNGSQLAAT